ncbi:hypothetical protein C2G38_2240206 [Gigaspora rosea]|uniref:Uncharacterized protein n=1 Tax=Gigaspora rosea TaxID=44941 RepID=A0A397VXL1_9GLOM|nr:hypothetical protein C2G38_2240206 [Gigaspora rosea]
MPDRKTRTYYIKKIILLLENYKSEIVKELTTLEIPRLKEYYRTALISISVNQEILEERIKEISIQNIEEEIVDKIIETLLYINNTKALVKEQEKQRNIYNNFLDNTQAQIEGIKKRLLAESPEFCKIFEDNPETGETEFYYGDYNNQFTILPFRFHHLILHHLEAIDNILYSEGARNKIYFEEEESYESAYSEINKLSQEFIDKTKKEIIIKELKEEYFKRTGRKIEYGYCTIASDIKEIEPEYLEHEELYKKLDYLHSIIINNIGQYLIKRKETYDTVGELNIYNCYSDNRTWNKLTIARSIFKIQEQVYQPYLGHEIGIVAANNLYADIIENIILSIKGDQFHQKIESTIEKAS